MEVNIYGVHGNNENIGICLSWSDEKIGFGQLVIEQSRDDKSITIDSECMDKPFIKEVFIALVDNAILIG